MRRELERRIIAKVIYPEWEKYGRPTFSVNNFQKILKITKFKNNQILIKFIQILIEFIEVLIKIIN